MDCGHFDDSDHIIYLCNWIWVERLLEMVADGRRRICATFTVRVVFGALYHTISGLLDSKVIKNSSLSSHGDDHYLSFYRSNSIGTGCAPNGR